MKPKILIFLLLLLFTTGCWNRKELNELGIVAAMGIDKDKEEYVITLQTVNPGEVAQKKATGRVPVTSYTGRGQTIYQAIRRLTTIFPRKPYFAHLRILVIGEEMARKEGVAKALDLVSRDHEFRTDFYVVIAKNNKAETVLKYLLPIEQIPAQNLYTKLESAEKSWAPASTIQLDELISDLVSTGKEPVLTGLKTKGPVSIAENKANLDEIDSPGRLFYSGLAVFKEDKLIGWLNEEESKGYEYIRNKVKSTVGVIPCNGSGLTSLEIIRTKADVKGKVKNGTPEIEISLFTEENVGEVQCKDLDLTDPKTVTKLEQNAEKHKKAILEASIKKAKKLNADIFGFGEVIHRSQPKEWKKLEKIWDKEFVKTKVTIKTDVKIRRTGTTNNSFLKELKKEP